MQSHYFGDTSVTQVIEQRGPGFAPEFLYPDWNPAVLEEHRDLMVPDCFDVVAQRFIASISIPPYCALLLRKPFSW